MIIDDTVVLDGELNTLRFQEDAEVGVFTALRDAYPTYTGETVVVPKMDDQILNTAMKTVLTDITVKEIPVYAVSNPQGGNTVYIGGEFDYG